MVATVGAGCGSLGTGARLGFCGWEKVADEWPCGIGEQSPRWEWKEEARAPGTRKSFPRRGEASMGDTQVKARGCSGRVAGVGCPAASPCRLGVQ